MRVIPNLIVDILSQPAIPVTLTAFIGLIIQKEPAVTITSGAIRTILGFLILGTGADIVVRSLEPFGKTFQHVLDMQGIIPNNEAIVSLALKDFGATAALIMVYGIIVNTLIACFTDLKYIFLTGHHTFYMAVFLAIILTVSHIRGWLTIIIDVLVLGLIIAVLPALLQPTVRKITGDNRVALGHFDSIGYFAADAVGQLFKDESRSTEEIKFPKGLSFLRESTISISITMALLYFIICLFAGASYVHESINGGQNFIALSLIQGVTLATDVFIILTGVRLILAEIVPVFKGTSGKLISNSKPASDYPIAFPYVQNAALIRFFVSLITGVAGMLTLFLFGDTVTLFGIVVHSFLGATIAVFGNAGGGIRDAAAGAALSDILITFLLLSFLPFLGELGDVATTFSDIDFLVVGIVFGSAVEYMELSGAILFIIVVGAATILLRDRQRPRQ